MHVTVAGQNFNLIVVTVRELIIPADDESPQKQKYKRVHNDNVPADLVPHRSVCWFNWPRWTFAFFVVWILILATLFRVNVKLTAFHAFVIGKNRRETMGNHKSILRRHLAHGDEQGALNLLKNNEDFRKRLDIHVNYEKNDGSTPFHLACLHGMETIIRYKLPVCFL